MERGLVCCEQLTVVTFFGCDRKWWLTCVEKTESLRMAVATKSDEDGASVGKNQGERDVQNLEVR